MASTLPIRVFHVDGRTADRGRGRAVAGRRADRSGRTIDAAADIDRRRSRLSRSRSTACWPARSAGLEVCRVVDDPVSGEVRLEVGIGAHDRETFQMLHGDRPKVEALADVVRTVAAPREPALPPHPLKHLGAEPAPARHAWSSSPA